MTSSARLPLIDIKYPRLKIHLMKRKAQPHITQENQAYLQSAPLKQEGLQLLAMNLSQ